MTRRFVVIGQKATASPDFSLTDIAGTSGRLDVLLRCLRAALCVSHGLRRETIVYLVLCGGAAAPRVLRVDASKVRFIRPDERALASMVQKALAADVAGAGFVRVRDGIAIARGSLDVVLDDLAVRDPPFGARYVLEEGADDLREAALDACDPVIFVGDHLGFDPATRAQLAACGAVPIGVGPVSVHADDAVTIVSNELDRREARGST